MPFRSVHLDTGPAAIFFGCAVLWRCRSRRRQYCYEWPTWRNSARQSVSSSVHCSTTATASVAASLPPTTDVSAAHSPQRPDLLADGRTQSDYRGDERPALRAWGRLWWKSDRCGRVALCGALCDQRCICGLAPGARGCRVECSGLKERDV